MKIFETDLVRLSFRCVMTNHLNGSDNFERVNEVRHGGTSTKKSKVPNLAFETNLVRKYTFRAKVTPRAENRSLHLASFDEFH